MVAAVCKAGTRMQLIFATCCHSTTWAKGDDRHLARGFDGFLLTMNAQLQFFFLMVAGWLAASALWPDRGSRTWPTCAEPCPGHCGGRRWRWTPPTASLSTSSWAGPPTLRRGVERSPRPSSPSSPCASGRRVRPICVPWVTDPQANATFATCKPAIGGGKTSQPRRRSRRPRRL